MCNNILGTTVTVYSPAENGLFRTAYNSACPEVLFSRFRCIFVVENMHQRRSKACFVVGEIEQKGDSSYFCVVRKKNRTAEPAIITQNQNNSGPKRKSE